MSWNIRPKTETDRGGCYCMPLKQNVPKGPPGWKLVHCPECGAECWRMPQAVIAEKQGAVGLCTVCALKNN